jgi:hypothetical protein
MGVPESIAAATKPGLIGNAENCVWGNSALKLYKTVFKVCGIWGALLLATGLSAPARAGDLSLAELREGVFQKLDEFPILEEVEALRKLRQDEPLLVEYHNLRNAMTMVQARVLSSLGHVRWATQVDTADDRIMQLHIYAVNLEFKKRAAELEGVEAYQKMKTKLDVLAAKLAGVGALVKTQILEEKIQSQLSNFLPLYIQMKEKEMAAACEKALSKSEGGASLEKGLAEPKPEEKAEEAQGEK